jgi:hypothetical protein
MGGTYRLIFLGAGFSQPAGLPLGCDLFQEVRKVNAARYGADNHLERDLGRYLRYLERCEGRSESPEGINYEEFLGFLDLGHYLGLKGKDTFSSDGNESQLMIRNGIAQVLRERTPVAPLPLYRRFARQLTVTDWVMTFNYDTILENALEAEGIPYRLFPHRYSDVGPLYSTVDDSREELVLLKLHGSIDWFDRSTYDETLAILGSSSTTYERDHPIFGRDRKVDPCLLTDGPRSADDPLGKIYRVKDTTPLQHCHFWQCVPLILAPSQTKILYARPIVDFWRGIQEAGGLSLSVGIVGYSLPPYDVYARQALYHVLRNYTGYEPDLELNGRTKTKIRLVDMRSDPAALADLQTRYRFIDWKRTETYLAGFNEGSADWLLR